MGRPIKKSYFANLNSPGQNQATGGTTGVGGEAVAGVTVSNSGTTYSQGATATISAPQLPGGVRAVAALTIPSTGANSGKVMAVAITNAGSGYTSAPTFTPVPANSVTKASTGTIATSVVYPVNTTGIYVGMQATGTGINASPTYVVSIAGLAVTLTQPNAAAVAGNVTFSDQGTGLAGTAILTTTQGSGIVVLARAVAGTASTGIAGDIMKQEGTNRYLVNTADGVAICKLVTTSTLAVAQMTIIATDSKGSTYYVSKLTAHKALLTQKTMVGSYEYVTGTPAHWSLSAATTGTVSIANV